MLNPLAFSVELEAAPPGACGCGSANGCGSGETCLCGSSCGGGEGACPC